MVIFSLIPLLYESYNPGPIMCMIDCYPMNCEASGKSCLRGKNCKVIRSLLLGVPISLSVTIIITTMSLTYASVRKQDMAVARDRKYKK